MIDLKKFNIFKKKEKISPIKYHLINLKLTKHDTKLYSGQFVKLECDFNEKNDVIDDVKYYFRTIEGEKITSYIPIKESEYCEKYDIGIIKDIDQDRINILLICDNVYINRYKIQLDKSVNNGEAFLISNGNLVDNNQVVGKIIDNRYDINTKILINSYENGLLNVLIKK